MNLKERQALRLDVEGTIYVLYSKYLERKSKGYKDYQISDSVLWDKARHRVASKLWYYRYRLGLSYRQAVEYLILPVRKTDKPVYLLEKKQVYVSYLDLTCEKILAAAIAEKIRNRSRMTLYRYAVQFNMRAKELKEYINRLIGYKQSCNTTVYDIARSNDRTIATDRKALQIDLVGQLERYLRQYVNRRIIVYGGKMLFSTINYTQLYKMIYCAYGRPDSNILTNIYKNYCDGGIYYKEDIIKDYVNRIKNMHN